MDYDKEIKVLHEKVGKLCQTVEMDIRLVVENIEKKNDKILDIVGNILEVVGGDK